MPRIDRPVLEPEYADAARPHGITAAIYIEVAVDDSSLEDEIHWIDELVDGPGVVAAGVAGWRPAGDAARTEAWLERLATESAVVGVREVLHPPERTAREVDDPDRLAACRLAGKHGLSVDLCVRPDQLDAATRLIRGTPDTRFVLDHLGRPCAAEAVDPAWVEAIRGLAHAPNVFVKLSALIECMEGKAWDPSSFARFTDIVLEAFGPERMIWGSNWPVCMDTPEGLDAWLAATDTLLEDLSPSERAWIMGNTARTAYLSTLD